MKFAWTALGLLLSTASHAVTRAQYELVIEVFVAEFSYDAAEHGRQFEILHDWKEDWAQAFARRWETDHLVVYGGAARIRGSTVDSFALVLCHEVGHLYGGMPYSDEFNLLSVEGQADYWAATDCWPRVAHQLNAVGDPSLRLKTAAQILTAHFALTRALPAPSRETPDPTVTTVTARTHPSPQCRLDTLIAGAESRDRPRCWFAP